MKNPASISILLLLILAGCSSLPFFGTKPEVHVIGVYEGSYPAGENHYAGHHPPGQIDILVRNNTRPVILILTSYEPVNWRFKTEENAKIEMVVLSGYYPSRVTGLGEETAISRQDIGYAYKMDARYGRIKQYCRKEFGVPPASFQYGYRGRDFIVK